MDAKAALLFAVQEQVLVVDTVTLPEPGDDPTDALLGEIVNLHLPAKTNWGFKSPKKVEKIKTDLRNAKYLLMTQCLIKTAN